MNRGGFTLIEVMVGMMIFVVGVMALASTTAFVSLQLQAADLRTGRNVAYQQMTERLRAMEFDSVKTRAKADGTVVADYTMWWDVDSLRWALKEVHVYSEGPAFRDNHRREDIVDTLTFRIARPVK